MIWATAAYTVEVLGGNNDVVTKPLWSPSCFPHRLPPQPAATLDHENASAVAPSLQ